MLLKKWQPNTEAIEELNSILKSYKLSQSQKTLINIMINNIQKGIQGEKNSSVLHRLLFKGFKKLGCHS
ncbi:hypothetical protein BLW93_07100 [Desulfurobacterium indicum]|uniref:Uncharacterized protein n=1 Tax=Desulfurobacterium indicum TaxID=1914305 RepID=A0A1R1MJU7_9BACT|nr:hypothetical protein BLW93_07100 [Desulfurobacterium indicum]